MISNELEVEIEDIADARVFILAGNAIFTLVGEKTRFTYRVRKKTFNLSSEFYYYTVEVLTGMNNNTDYTNIGKIIDMGTIYKYTLRNNEKEAPLSVRAFAWFFKRLMCKLPDINRVKFYHVGRCGRCGRRLTTPESIQTGMGEICASKM